MREYRIKPIDPHFCYYNKLFYQYFVMKKNKVWAIIGCIALILILLLWLGEAFLWGDTDVNGNTVLQCMAMIR